MAKTDTIAAIATPAGRGGIGVVRVSGKNLRNWPHALLGKKLSPRVASYAKFLNASGDALDQGIAIYFPAPHSFTGEDVLELQGHGGNAVLGLVLARCIELGARLAAPGEFTQRAFLNNKIDLAQAEAVADLIDAASTEAARSALRSLTGEFSQWVHRLALALIDLRVQVEGGMDFPEEDLVSLAPAALARQLDELLVRLHDLLSLAQQGNLLREGLRVVILGRPNVGKSSLMNRLAGEDVAIVTPQPGTTRDSIRHGITVQGVPLEIIDTAGLRATEDIVELAGMQRTYQELERANIVLSMVDASQAGSSEQGILAGRASGLPRVTVVNKIDLVGKAAEVYREESATTVFVSAKTGAGLDLLRQELLRSAGWQGYAEGVFMARERHLLALSEAAEALKRAAAQTTQVEVLAEELRHAQNALNRITGEFGADDLLGEIFSRFCIGK